MPKDIEDCKGGALKREIATVSAGPDKELQVCPEDRAKYGALGYYPQTFRNRLFGSTQQKPRYEILYVIVPCIAGLIEGNNVVGEARRAGIETKYKKAELKKKGFAYGYWRAVILILFASTLLAKENRDAAMASMKKKIPTRQSLKLRMKSLVSKKK